jgi:glycosyltransferase involved in cell wall biosynthesis
MAEPAPVRGRHVVAELVNCLGIGGTERQLVELLRHVDRNLFATDLCCLQKVGEYLTDVRALSLEPQEFSLRGSLLRPNTIVQVARLSQRLRSEGAQLVHSHDFYSNLIGAAAATLAGIPYIVSRRDTGAWVDWKRAQLIAAVTRRAPFVLCNAYAVRDQLVYDEQIDPERITVVHNGLDLDRFDAQASAEPEPPPFVADDGPVVVLVANMKHPVKGHDDMLRAASLVHRTAPECRFLLIGDGALRPELQAQAHKLGIENAVIFAGRRNDVPALLARCHIAVSASHAEGLPNSVMEAMAARLPVVATAVGGTVELVRDGRTGFLVRRGDPVGLAARISELARRGAFARRMGLAGRRRIEDEFSSVQLGERINAFYASILRLRQEERRAA